MTIEREKLKTAETTTLSFLNDSTKFNYTRGKLRDVLKYIEKNDLKVMFSIIENTPMYAPKIPLEEKIAKIKQLKDSLNLN